MKNKILLLAILLMCTFSTVNVNGAINKKDLKAKVAAMTEEQKEARIQQIKDRVEEIKQMDKSQLTKEDRKQLRHELRDMNKEAKALGSGGVYISLAGLVIIILLLILIL
ncbi:MAG: hypothetical protein ACTHJ5_17950 [Ilyomonas sp.]